MNSLLLSNASNRQTVPARMFACLGCLMPYWVKEGERDPEFCPACQRSNAQAEAVKLSGAVRELINGTGIFSILSRIERQEQLRQLGLTVRAKENGCCDPVPTMRLVRTMASEVAAELGELVYDSDGYQPSPEERDDIESRIEAPELEAEAMDALNVYETDLM